MLEAPSLVVITKDKFPLSSCENRTVLVWPISVYPPSGEILQAWQHKNICYEFVTFTFQRTTLHKK